MRKFHFLLSILFLFLFLSPHNSLDAQQTENKKEPRILFLVDASGSMALEWLDGQTRFDAASELILQLVDEAQLENNKISFGIRVFGANYPAEEENCYDTNLEVPFRYQNRNQIRARMRSLQPKGYSPIAYSLEKAAKEDFKEDDKYSYSLILITDGGESCDGDICKIMEELLAKKISFKPYIISLVNESPLQDLYACLGEYVLVENKKDIENIVERILEENQLDLQINYNQRIANKNTVSKPKEEQITISVDKPKVEKEPEMEEEPELIVKEEENPIITPTERKVSELERKLKFIPVLIKPSKKSVQIAKVSFKTFTKPLPKPLPLEEEEEEVAKAPPIPKKDLPPMAPAEPEKREQPLKQPEKISDVYIEKEDADKTYVQIYFTDGNGKFYWTQPRIKIHNANNNEEILSINRRVNGQSPEKIEIAAGVYNFLVSESESSANNVTIEENKTNKVYIRVSRGSLAFYHPEEPDIAITQYTALVSKRFDRGSPVVQHPTDTVLPYDPANYHIEINTLPPLMYNIDLNFTSLKMVAIPQPGYIQITNSAPAGHIEFWFRRGGRYLHFHDMQITGNLEDQIREFLPGHYQIRFYRGARYSGGQPEIIPFSIKRKETVSLEVK
ncbi:MAG TPA: VWA domain-containing protein [Chitinophagaceae bacterium]|nr:VWA domain-containing protein [Chitinophagaceae bacterium]